MEMLWERLNRLGLLLWVPMWPERARWCNKDRDFTQPPAGVDLDNADQVAKCRLTGQRAFFDVGADCWVPLLEGGN